MKKLFNLTFLGLILFAFTNCEQSLRQDEILDETTLTPMIYNFSSEGGTYFAEAPSLSDLKELAINQVTRRSHGNSSTNGMFNTGTSKAVFSAMKNPSGVHGNMHLKATSDGAFFIDVKIENECISGSGNMAVFGGTVTHSELGDPNVPFTEGWKFFFGVIDNGQGSSSTGPDEIASAFGIIPPGFVSTDFGFETWCDWFVCDLDYDCGDHGHDYFQGVDPTNIKVK